MDRSRDQRIAGLGLDLCSGYTRAWPSVGRCVAGTTEAMDEEVDAWQPRTPWPCGSMATSSRWPQTTEIPSLRPLHQDEFAATFRRSDLQRQVEELTGSIKLVRFCPHPPAQESEIRRAGDLLREIRLHFRTHKGLH